MLNFNSGLKCFNLKLCSASGLGLPLALSGSVDCRLQCHGGLLQ